MTNKERSFEEMLAELEGIAQSLEAGDQPLDEMVRLYTQGVELAAACRGKIDTIEAKLAEDSEEKNGK